MKTSTKMTTNNSDPIVPAKTTRVKTLADFKAEIDAQNARDLVIAAEQYRAEQRAFLGLA